MDDYYCTPENMAALEDDRDELRQEVERLRAALGEIAKLTDVDADVAPGIARRALEK